MTDLGYGLSVSPEGAVDSPGRGSNSAGGPAAAGASVSSNGPTLNARSCVTCRRRKVKCNKQYPCSNCLKAHIDCIFPAPGRAPRRPRKPPDGELLGRLRRLEGVIQSLGVQVDDDPNGGPSITTEGQSRDGMNQDGGQVCKISFPSEQAYDQRRDSVNGLNSELGRLVINEGRARYVNSRFWVALSSEVEDLKGVLDESSDEEADLPSPVSDRLNSTPTQYAFLLNSNTTSNDLHLLHPPPDHIRKYWTLFIEHCDPLMKMLHIPTMQQQIFAVVNNPGRAPKAIELLLFAVYYATITSLTAEECLSISGETQDVLTRRYRHGLEQALTRAHFLITEEIVVLQAFIIFLICLRRHEDPRVLWSLCGVACRLAITLGLHHDGSRLDISPFDIEIRRRTWWQILILDIRSAEDHGSDPVIIQHSFDTRFPLNIEDEDIKPAMTEVPAERIGITKMSFCLTRYYTAMTFARLFARPASFLSPTGSWPEPTLQQKQKWIQDCTRRLDERFFQHYNMDDPLHYVTHTVSKLILAKQWLMVYQPYLKSRSGFELPAPTRDHLFVTSLEAIEASMRLEQQRKTVKWGWLFKTYTQFHAMAFILSELTRRTSGPLVDRAWNAVDHVKRVLWQADTDLKQPPLIRPLLKLEATARRARANAEAQAQRAESEESDASYIKTEPTEPQSQTLDFSTAQANQALNHGFSGFDNWNIAGFDGNAMQTGFPMQQMPSGSDFSSFYHRNTANPFPTPGLFPVVNQAPSAWTGVMSGHVPSNNNVAMGDWFADPSFGTIPGADASGSYQLNQLQPQNAQQQQHQQQQQQQTRDPMVSGSEGNGAQWNDWDEIWDEMMVTGQSAAGQGQHQQWQRRPMMNETWL